MPPERQVILSNSENSPPRAGKAKITVNWENPFLPSGSFPFSAAILSVPVTGRDTPPSSTRPTDPSERPPEPSQQRTTQPPELSQ